MRHRILLLALLLAAFAAVSAASALGSPATLRVEPVGQTVTQGETFNVDVIQNASVATSGAQANLEFDHTLVEIVSVSTGPAYTGASFLLGVAPQTKAEAIAEANTTGILKNASAFFLPGSGSVPAGDAVFLAIEMKAKQADGVAKLELAAVEMLDDTGSAVTVDPEDGSVAIQGGGGDETPTPTPGGPTPVVRELVWGDGQCDEAADQIDTLITLRFDAGLSVNSGDCPSLGTELEVVEIGTAGLGGGDGDPQTWGNVDCDGLLGPTDALKLLRHDAALNVSQEEDCPPIGADVTVQHAP